MGIIIARNNNILFISSKYELPNFTTNTIKLNDILQAKDLNSQALQDMTKIFQLLQLQYNVNKEIDKYEFCIIMILFKKNSLEHKIEEIFNLITQTGILNFSELFWITQSFIRATCKINLIQIPSFDQILKFTQRMYQQMRKDLEEKIMLIEMIDFVKSNSEVSQFLLKYYKIQTYENAFRQQELKLVQYINIFQKSVGLSQKYVNVDALLLNWNQDTQDQQYLISLMLKQQQHKKQERNFIKLSQFLHVISNYLAYKINDIDNNNTLSLDFINYLIYAQEEIIISAERYEQIKLQLCKERQIITLQMWMDYQCLQEANRFESQLRTLLRFYEIIYTNNSFDQLIQKINKLINNCERKNFLQNIYISQSLKNWIQKPDLYNVGSIELKLKIEQLLRK